MTYTIIKGNHFSGLHFGFQFKKVVKHTVTFDESCIYDIENLDINKLFGFSYGLVHKNSCRFGWRYNNGLIDILAYVYNDGSRIKESDANTLIARVSINDTCEYSLWHDSGFYYFKVTKNGDICGFLSLKSGRGLFPIKFKCYPYFGGKKPASQEIRIRFD